MAKPSKKKTEDLPKLSKKEERLFQNLLKVTYEYIKSKRYTPQSRHSLIDKLRIHPDHLAIFDHVLKDLKDKGSVVESLEKYVKTEDDNDIKANIATGTIKVHHKGFGFVSSPDLLEDVFIPKPCMNNAVDGDTVEILISSEVTEKGPEGKVLSITSRKHDKILATVVTITKSNMLAYSSLLKNTVLVEIVSTGRDTILKGDRILVEVTQWGSKDDMAEGVFLKKIGNIEDPSTDIICAILEHDIPTEFTKEAEQEAESFGTKVSKQDLIGREDLTDLECFTIDPDTAKDFDDAISLLEDESGYTLGVHIADVSHYVTPHSHLDKVARIRCNSTYFPGLCVPMLPHALSDNLCSLREGVIRLCASVFMHFTKDGKLLSWHIKKSFIKSKKRFTYKQVKKILDGKLKSKHEPTLQRMLKFCNLLKEKRAERGSVQLYMPELFIHIDKDGVPTGTELIEYDVTHQMVEEFMLKANEIVALHLTNEGKNVTFRVHDEPSKESLRDFAALATAFGYKLKEDPDPMEIQKFFNTIEEGLQAQYLATCYIRSMKLAIYSPENIGHYGLSLDHYTHFTSPIRRYIDTIIHRLLFGENIEKHILNDLCTRASERERISSRAESSVMFLKKLRLIDAICKKDSERSFEAIITKVKPHGIYFDVMEFMIEGFLHISELGNDYYIFDEKAHMLYGKYEGGTFIVGEKTFVIKDRIDLVTQEATWTLVQEQEDDVRSFKRKPRRRNDRAKKLKKKT